MHRNNKRNMRVLFPLFLILFSFLANGQLPYTTNEFTYTVETDVEYAQDINYVGINESLLMDIYRPVGDNNCTRPCLVLIHGGTFIAGSKADVNIVNIARSFAEKGWVVSTINYRLGTLKNSYHERYAFCGDDIAAPCAYISDSTEIYRANYRGQQDAKAAIRFMKNRHELDSTDVNNFFVTGESAGAFIAFATAFMNNETEKPVFCGVTDDGPSPDADLESCLPDGYSLTRPDLGPVTGTKNLGGFDASVQGVGGYYGGMMDLDMLNDETDWPVLYMFHQGSDVVVNYDYGRVLGRIDWECFAPTSLCQPYAKYPRAYGSKGIETYLATLGSSPTRTVEIIENYEYMGDCLDNGHSIDNWITRSNNMAELYATRVQENGNTPNDGPCFAAINESQLLPSFKIYPNPTDAKFTVKIENYNVTGELKIYKITGELLLTKTILNSIELEFEFEPGVYLVDINSGSKVDIVRQKLIVY